MAPAGPTDRKRRGNTGNKRGRWEPGHQRGRWDPGEPAGQEMRSAHRKGLARETHRTLPRPSRKEGQKGMNQTREPAAPSGPIAPAGPRADGP